MVSSTLKTDNSHLADKIELRVQSLPAGKRKIRVLDAFAGSNTIWNAVRDRSPRVIFDVVSIEKEPGKGGIHLQGDNRKFLPTLDLKKFDIIDLDGQGIPLFQVDTVLSSGFGGILHITFTQSILGNVNTQLLRLVGITDRMIRKAKAIFARKQWEYFKGYLGSMGVRRIQYLEFGRKRFIVINLAKP